MTKPRYLCAHDDFDITWWVSDQSDPCELIVCDAESARWSCMLFFNPQNYEVWSLIHQLSKAKEK